jgi:hypothetical protein
MDDRSRRWRGKGLCWFILLWLAGVAGAGVLTLPFHLLVAMALNR